MQRTSWFFLGSLAFLSACGGRQAAPAVPPAGEAAPEGTEAPEQSATGKRKPWDDLTHNERLDVMKKVVVPTMKPLFQAQDPVKFKEFGCATCHGPGAKEGKYDMPNPGLTKLNPADGFKAHKEKTPEMLAFMMEKVRPEMAKAIGEPEMTAETKTGFACMNCHTTQ